MDLRLLRGTLCGLALVASAPAAAADPKLDGKIRALLDRAVAEHTIFLNCLATVPGSAAPVIENWRRDIAEARILLGKLGLAPAEIAAFAARAAPEQLIRRDAAFSEILALCAADPEWDARLYRLDHVLLAIDLGDLLTQRDKIDAH